MTDSKIENGSFVYAGLCDLDLNVESYNLGHGIRLTKTYAHLMAPFMMAFTPAVPGSHHPPPWKAANGGSTFNITAELRIPFDVSKPPDLKGSIARTLIFLLRLGINPAIKLTVLSNYSFTDLPKIPDNKARLIPFEVQWRYFPIKVDNGKATAESLQWIKDRWRATHDLINESAEFALAVEAIELGQFIQNSSLSLLALWAALEALFSPNPSELKFRVSSLIAVFLEPPGEGRAKLQRKIAKLYDKRSAAAHGRPKHKIDDLLEVFNLLRRVLIVIIEQQNVPSKEGLEAALFGCR